MQDLSVSLSDGGVSPGEAYLDNTPVLRGHAGTQPDLLLRWNRIPLSAQAIDIAVFLHGFSQQGGEMPLAEKVERSGLDLSGRGRPTLAMLPRGNWIRHYYYDFPALLSGGIDQLVDYGLSQFSRALASHAFAVDRFILAAHSGGGMPAIDIISDASRLPDELHVFDGLYGRDPASGNPFRGLEVIEGWLGDRLRREPERQGALRVVYIEQQTGAFSRKVAELIARHLASAEPARAESLSRRYRVEISGVQHSQIARRCMPELLSAPDAQFNWLEQASALPLACFGINPEEARNMAFYELRQYKVLPGKMDEWVRIMEQEIIPFQTSKGMVICGSFRGETDDSVYIWLRRFESEAEREAQYKAVYESDYWKNEIAPRVPNHLDRSAMVVTRIIPTAESKMR